MLRNAKLYYDQSKKLKADQNAINNFFSRLKEVNADDITDALRNIKSEDVASIFEKASDSCKKFGAELGSTAKTYDEAAAQSKKFIQSQHDSMLAMNGLGKVAKGAGAAFKGFAATIENMLIITAIIAVIDGLVKVFKQASYVCFRSSRSHRNIL